MTVFRKGDVTPVTAADSPSGYPEPYNAGLGDYSAVPISDAGGLTQFGAFTETLPPGSMSSLRHWHENEDEFIFVLDGEVTLVDDSGPQILHPGDAATFKAGDPNGHHLVNRSGAPVTYLVVGTRAQFDRAHYPDIDMVYVRDGEGRRFTRRDGSILKVLGKPR